MNNNKGNYTSGIILIVLGSILFGIINDFFDFEVTIRQIAKFWPLFIVAGGLAVFLNERKTIFNPLTALLVSFAIPLGIYNSTVSVIDNAKSEINENLNFEFDTDNDNDDENNIISDSISFSKLNQSIEIPLDAAIENVNLKVQGGAAEFFLSESLPSNVFETAGNDKITRFNIDDSKQGKKQNIEVSMKMKNKKFNFGTKNLNNDVKLKLNKKPIWDLDLEFGAGKLDFDLSSYKVKNINLETGAADVSLKLGSLLTESSLNIESGAASIHLDVPKEVGCQIEMDGALNANDFNGFTKISSGLWQSENYKSTSKKIFIKLDSGLSAIKVERY